MPQPPERSPGDVLEGRYRLAELLGRGGFGDVWRAEELLPDGSALREVALKLLHREPTDSQDWSEEARIIASLRHPALVTIYAAGLLQLDRPRPYVAMELLLGETLAAHVDRGERVPWRRVLDWAREAAAALDEIHRAGVVHLDLKPANLFLTRTGELKVLDFGIARQGRARSPSEGAAPSPLDEMSTAEFVAVRSAEVARDEAVSSAEPAVAPLDSDGQPAARSSAVTRSVVGTPGFMAPEILEDAEASPASDAYALAACIVQLTTGRLPQKVEDKPGSDAATSVMRSWLSQVQSATVCGQIRDLTADRADLPPALVELLGRWLSLDPHARRVERGRLRKALDEVWDCPHGWSGNPYRGLSPYRPEDEGKLFGRTDDIARIGRELVHQPCVVMHGARGIGLRSLALAGVVPFVGRSFADGRDDWGACTIELDDAPDRAVERAIESWLKGQQLAADSPSEQQAQSRADAHEPAGQGDGAVELDGQVDLFDRLLGWAAQARVGVVLVLGRFDRLLAAPAAERKLTEKLIVELAQRPARSGVRLLATVREEHTVEVLQMGAAGAALRPWLRFMASPAATAAAAIASEPARRSKILVDDLGEVIEELQGELREEGTRLPLVSLALQAWWDAAEREGRLSRGQWQAAGGVIGVAAAHADRVLERLPYPRAADAVLLRLLAADGTALEVDAAELEGERGPGGEPFGELLETLAQQGLVARRAGKLRLAHPELTEAWRHLHDLRLQHMDRLAVLEELRADARRWAEAGEPRSALWTRDRLRGLDRSGGAELGEPGRTEQTFVEASRQAIRLGWALRALVAVGLVAAVVGVLALRQTLEERAHRQAEARAQAERREAVGRMVTRSRRTRDPYHRVALLAGAMGLGSSDPMLPLELQEAAVDLPKAEFLSLGSVRGPDFFWDSRWLIGGAGSATLTIFDFKPLEHTPWGPLAKRLRPHPKGTDALEPFAFDSSFVTRGLDGQLRIWRLRRNGELALAALSPMRCVGGLNAVLLAEAAPVVACATAEGLARWDLRRADRPDVDSFHGRVLDLSRDGGWLGAARLSRVLLWHPQSGRRIEFEAEDEAPSLARFSPRDPVVALVHRKRLAVLEIQRGSVQTLLEAPTIADPVDARWHGGGLDLAVCGYDGQGRWHYLRNGARSPDDGPPPIGRRPCERPAKDRPARLEHVRDYGEPLAAAGVGSEAGRYLGPRRYAGGWRLDDGRVITHDLVMLDPPDRRAQQLLRFQGLNARGEPETAPSGASAMAVARDGEDRVLWQVGRQIRLYDLSGKRLLGREGNLLRRCPDGRLLGWRKDSEREWHLIEARHNRIEARVVREPAFVLGADATCRTVFFQRLSGELAGVEVPAVGEEPVKMKALEGSAGELRQGYVYDVRDSAGGGQGADALEPGLWLAFSSGVMARLEGPRGALRAYGQAIPRPTAMADGPKPGQLLFADATGLVLRERSHTGDRRLLDPSAAVTWEDLRVLPGGDRVLLGWPDGLAVLDLHRREIVGRIKLKPTQPRGRLAPWDDEGSVLLWSHAFKGGASGEVIPIGPELARQIAHSVSNLRAYLGPKLEVRIGLAP